MKEVKPPLTQDEHAAIRALYSSGSDDAPLDCMECGFQIDSARQIKYEGAILCAKCASKLVQPDTCGKGSD